MQEGTLDTPVLSEEELSSLHHEDPLQSLERALGEGQHLQDKAGEEPLPPELSIKMVRGGEGMIGAEGGEGRGGWGEGVGGGEG